MINRAAPAARGSRSRLPPLELSFPSLDFSKLQTPTSVAGKLSLGNVIELRLRIVPRSKHRRTPDSYSAATGPVVLK